MTIDFSFLYIAMYSSITILKASTHMKSLSDVKGEEEEEWGRWEKIVRSDICWKYLEVSNTSDIW